MAGSLTGTPYRDEFFRFLRTKGRLSSDHSAASYISYMNNLCRNMVNRHVGGATKDSALAVLIDIARDARDRRDFLQAIETALRGERGRFQDLRSAASQFFEFVKGGKITQIRVDGGQRQSRRHSSLEHALPSQKQLATKVDRCEEPIAFQKIRWLRNPPQESLAQSLDEFFELLPLAVPPSIGEAKGSDFDEAIRSGLIELGCRSVSALDTQQVYPGANYTFDLTAATAEGVRLFVEIEKTEVKRIIHDILKIAAGQRQDPRAIGLIIVPDRYRTANREYPRTHLDEAIATMELLDYAHAWAGGAIGVVVYKTPGRSRSTQIEGERQ